MVFRVGDAIFNASGKPAYISRTNQDRSQLEVNQDRSEVLKQHRHGYINGLSENDRADFNQIIDDIKKITDPQTSMLELKERIDKLNEDPKNVILVHYLEAELSHIMNTLGVAPRTYIISGQSAF